MDKHRDMCPRVTYSPLRDLAVPLFQIGMQELYVTIALQSEWYTSGFLTRSSDQSESFLVNQIRRSIFLSSSLLPSLCVRNVYKAYPKPGFSMENVLKLHAPLHCTGVHNFCQKCVFIICPIQMLSYTKLYDILRMSE